MKMRVLGLCAAAGLLAFGGRICAAQQGGTDQQNTGSQQSTVGQQGTNGQANAQSNNGQNNNGQNNNGQVNNGQTNNGQTNGQTNDQTTNGDQTNGQANTGQQTTTNLNGYVPPEQNGPPSTTEWTPYEKVFLFHAAQANLGEIQLSQMAVDHATSPDVKQFAQKIIDEHTQANEQLRTLARQGDAVFPYLPSTSDLWMIQHLPNMQGNEFDRAYVRQMVRDHQGGLADFRIARASARDEAVRQYASGLVPSLASHTQMITQIAQTNGYYAGLAHRTPRYRSYARRHHRYRSASYMRRHRRMRGTSYNRRHSGMNDQDMDHQGMGVNGQGGTNMGGNRNRGRSDQGNQGNLGNNSNTGGNGTNGGTNGNGTNGNGTNDNGTNGNGSGQ